MLTGDETLTSGNAYCLSSDLRSSRTEFLSNIGYCPQFDAIIGALTGREMLQLFCHLRGVSSGEIKTEVDNWLRKLGKNY
jgi:ATP-binding cassette subfamily A (ABC1) protein 3